MITKTLVGHVDNSADPSITVNIDLTLTTPADAKGPVPVIMEFGLSKEFLAHAAQALPAVCRSRHGNGPTWQQQVLAKGWGYADYIPTSIQADNGAGLTKGIIGLGNKGQPRKLDDWGALRAWAWGASRASTTSRPTRPSTRSRSASRATRATARRRWWRWPTIRASPSATSAPRARAARSSTAASSASRWTTSPASSEYHWMAGNFLKYAGPLTPGDLPVDAHELIALCAPRPVFISGGVARDGDGWVDAKGMFLAAAAAGPVYRLLGKKDLGTTEFPPMETALIDGDIAFRQHAGGHTPAPNWPTFLTFAEPLSARARRASRHRQSCSGSSDRRAGSRTNAGAARTERCAHAATALGGDAKAANATNYDQSKANVYPNIPDPLLLKNGRRCDVAGEWWFETTSRNCRRL